MLVFINAQERSAFLSSRSRGKSHGTCISAGIAAVQVRKASEIIKKFSKSQEQDIARVTFSDFSRGKSTASARKVCPGLQLSNFQFRVFEGLKWLEPWQRSEFYHFVDDAGNDAGYAKQVRKDSQLARFKRHGVVSHLLAQKQGILEFFKRAKVAHCVITRMFDDTNVWVSPQVGRGLQLPPDGTEEPESASEEDSPPGFSNVGRLGRKRVAQLLGLLQTVSVRRTDKLTAEDGLETARVMVPSQVLPKAAQHACFSVFCTC